MTHLPGRLVATLAIALLVAACAPSPELSEDVPPPTATGPQYAPGDPCKGVVPQLCPV